MNWDTRKIRKPNNPRVEWLKIGEIGNPAVTLGVLRNGSWVVETSDGIIDLKDNKALTFALPVLNSSMHEFADKISGNRWSNKAPHWIEFPLEELTVYAIQNGGGYWAEQALPWVLEIGVKKESLAVIIEGLIAFEKDKSNSQKFRQKVFIYRNKFEEALNTLT